MKPDAEITLPCFSSYLDWLTYEKRYSAHTISSYQRDLRHLQELVAQQDIAEISSRQIRRHITQLHQQGLQGRSLSRLLSAWRSYFNFLIRHHHLQTNPCHRITVPRTSKKLPEALLPDQAVSLVSPSAQSVIDIRDKAMFELLYACGLRVSELTALNEEQIDFSTQEIRVQGKGNKTRIVPVGQPAVQALQHWLQKRGELALPDEAALFVGKRGQRISPRVVQRNLKQWALRHGQNNHVYPHLLRHSYASHLLQSSGDLRAVQELLGHSNISSTQVYTHLDFQYLNKIYDQAHPRARRKTDNTPD